MEGRTTEELFAVLSPEAREEAIRLAARLQDRGDEGAHLVAAAREAGITDANLRAAAERMVRGRIAKSLPTTSEARRSDRKTPLLLPAELALAALLAAAQFLHAGSVSGLTHQVVNVPLLALTIVLGAGLGGVGRWWTGLAVVVNVWLMILLPMHLMYGRSGLFGPHTVQESLMGYAMLHSLAAVALGIVLARALPALKLGRWRAALETAR